MPCSSTRTPRGAQAARSGAGSTCSPWPGVRTRTECENVRNTRYDSVSSGDHEAFGGLYHVYVEVEKLGDPAQEAPVKLVTVRVEHQGEAVLTTETYKVEYYRPD